MTVRHLIFDLDNTLYESTGAMDRGITERMLSAVAAFFHITFDEAVALRNRKLSGFSTTLEWLMSEGLTDTESYFAAVHPESEAQELKRDERLRPLLESIPLPKTVLTNAPREHAVRVLKIQGVLDLFGSVCDIRDCGLHGKPYGSAYRTALEKAGGTVADTLFFDDLIKYTDGYRALGGTAVLVGHKNGNALSPQAEQRLGIEYTGTGRTLQIDSVYSLPQFLQSVTLAG